MTTSMVAREWRNRECGDTLCGDGIKKMKKSRVELNKKRPSEKASEKKVQKKIFRNIMN